ncbi:MAG: P-II family nitrogen regulator [bacterium]
MLHEIVAVIRTNKWKPTAEALLTAGFPALTRQRVFGRGRQRGLRYAGSGFGSSAGGVAVLPKWMFTLLVEDERVDAALAALLSANRSGMIGDGKVFICPLGVVGRFSDGATGRAALETGFGEAISASKRESEDLGLAPAKGDHEAGR